MGGQWSYCFKVGPRNGGPEMSSNECLRKSALQMNLSKMKNGISAPSGFSHWLRYVTCCNVSRVTYWNTALKNKMNADEAYADEVKQTMTIHL